MEYILRYCYRYEPGFTCYSVWDVILYKESDKENYGEIRRYLEKEDILIDKEDEHQIFFRVRKFYSLDTNVASFYFLKLALYPKESKENSVVNLLFFPLEKSWEIYSRSEKEQILDKIVSKEEIEIGFEYKIVEEIGEEIYVEDVVEIDNISDMEEIDEISDITDV